MAPKTPPPKSTEYLEIEKKLSAFFSRFSSLQAVHNGWVSAGTYPKLGEASLVATKLSSLDDSLNQHLEQFHLDVSDPDEIKALKKIFEGYATGLFSLQSKVNQIKVDIEAALSARKSSTPFKLEKIQLPKFNGNFSQWNNFYDLFTSAVVNNSGLNDQEKMVYLKSSLTHDAASIVSSFSSSSTSFAQAWDLVRNRFRNQREIAFAHLRKFDDLKSSKESAQGLRKLIDILNECTSSLKAMSVPVEHWDVILVFLALKKLDMESRKEWLLSQVSNDLPKLTPFVKFLENRATALADSSLNPGKSHNSASNPNPKQGEGQGRVLVNHQSMERKGTCYQCKGYHRLYQCTEFASCPVSDRRSLVKDNKLCFNCLFPGHAVDSCKMKFSCRTCGKKHHSLLHMDSSNSAPTPQATQSSSASSSSASKPVEDSTSSNPTTMVRIVSEPSSSSININQPTQEYPTYASFVPIHETALVYMYNARKEKYLVRMFLDSGAGSNIISKECAEKLGLTLKDTHIQMKGFQGAQGPPAKKWSIAHVHSRTEEFSLMFDVLVVDEILGSYLPGDQCKSNYEYLKDIPLADPSWNLSGKIDILLSTRCLGKLIRPGYIIGPIGSPDARNTAFGWVVSGEASPVYDRSTTSNGNYQIDVCLSSQGLDASVQRFWEIEEGESSKSIQSKEDLECEELFSSTISREGSGRYMVSLPFKSNSLELGHSRNIAMQRFTRLESKLSKEKDIYDSYNSQMQEHIEKQIMEEIPSQEIDIHQSMSYYMPHHVVSKLESSSTKHRIVFDASAKTSNGISLNDILMSGPKLQVDLVPLLLRFRTYVVGMSADIVKFYNQVLVNKESSDFQRLIWRPNANSTLKDYRMKRVTFGVTSAPFLAIRVLHQLAKDYEEEFPLVHSMLTQEFLVDNLLSGGNTIEEALAKQTQIIQVIENGQMKLRKWASNCSELIQSVPSEDREIEFPCNVATDEVVSTIGILWNPHSDVFSVKVPDLPISPVSTKRQVLSAIARVFDPLGWLSPVTVRAKILLQELWKAKLDWDSPIPHDLQKKWNKYCNEFQSLKEFQINRCIVLQNMQDSQAQHEVHAFSDASDDAYSACIYMKSQSPKGNVSTELICAKTKVAPVKTQTTPRLELCGAALLVKVVKTFLSAIDVPISSVHCYTDSTSVLGQLTTERKLDIFENNRVSKINSTLPDALWHHVPGDQNPADCASRGISVNSFLIHKLWKHGPEFLQVQQHIHVHSILDSNSNFFETQVSKLTNSCSSFQTMKRRIAYWIRFINCLKSKVYNSKPLDSAELKQALVVLIKSVQKESLQQEINSCKRKENQKSKIKNLAPFMDQDNVLRVGGRLRNSFFSYDLKHPILLPKDHNFTTAVVRHFHESNVHAGPQLLLALVRAQFWIPRGPQICSEIVRKCVQCHRSNPQTLSQLMGQLPEERVTPSHPFSQVGVDYAGPFFIAQFKGRNPKILKAYVCVFVCLSVKAIHLELAGDLSSESFIGALKRFVSRRGLVNKIVCDGGRNFLGAKNEVMEIQKFLESPAHQSKVQRFFAQENMEYKFNPPYAPHHGGIFEAAVKSFKTHLHKVIGDRHFSMEEITTLLCEVEAALNARPLCPMSQDPNDFNYLSPGHFLIGRPLKSIPQENLNDFKPHSLSRWQHVQQISQHFFQRWSTQYIQSLQKLTKWFQEQPNLGVGALVLLNDSDTPIGPQSWRLGRISAVHPGKDKLVRVCDVKVPVTTVDKKGNKKIHVSTYRRPITKISPLPIESMDVTAN